MQRLKITSANSKVRKYTNVDSAFICFGQIIDIQTVGLLCSAFKKNSDLWQKNCQSESKRHYLVHSYSNFWHRAWLLKSRFGFCRCVIGLQRVTTPNRSPHLHRSCCCCCRPTFFTAKNVLSFLQNPFYVSQTLS